MEVAPASFKERRANLDTFLIPSFSLDSGATLENVEIGYRTYGRAQSDNAIYICHSLSADCHITDYGNGSGRGWWSKFVGCGKTIDTDCFFIVCSNFLGGCFGSTGPSSKNPQTGQPYGSAFPVVTMKDVVRCKHLLLQHLGIQKVHAVIGGSFGGAQALQFLIDFPERFKKGIVIAANSSVSSFARGTNRLARWAIENDSKFFAGDYYSRDAHPDNGLALARAILEHAFITAPTLQSRFGRLDRDVRIDRNYEFNYPAHLLEQGRRFSKVFDANTFCAVLRLLDYYDLGAEAQIVEKLSEADFQLLHYSVATDAYFSKRESGFLLDTFASAGIHVESQTINSQLGHDVFFSDVESIGPFLKTFLSK